MVAAVLVLGVIALGLAALRGWTHDSRDPDFAMGRIFDWTARRSGSDTPPAGTLPDGPEPS
jgi:hypothetical protein